MNKWKVDDDDDDDDGDDDGDNDDDKDFMLHRYRSICCLCFVH